MKRFLVFTALVSAFFARPALAVETVEYKMVVLTESLGGFSPEKSVARIEKTMNSMGAAGWRLVSVNTIPQKYDHAFVMFFERSTIPPLARTKGAAVSATKETFVPIPEPEATTDDEPDPIPTARAHVPDPSGRTFLKTQSAGLQEVVVGRKVKVMRTDGKIAVGTILEVSEVAIVIDTGGQRLVIDAAEIAQITKAN